MLTQQSPASATAAPQAGALDPEHKVQIATVTLAGTASIVGALLGSLGLVWVLFERLLPFSGVLGFLVCWYVVFLLLYAAIALMQWDKREVTHRVTQVIFATTGALAITVVLGQVLFTLLKGFPAIRHPNFWTQSMAFAGPLSSLGSGGVFHAMVGTLEQISLATMFSVPLAVTAALFLAEVGGSFARVVRVIVEAMTALPDVIAGLFVYALFLLTLGFQRSGLAAAIALSVTMMPVIARGSEVMLRLVPGTLREASYALGSSQWRTAWNVILPTARSGLTTAVVLGMARGIGETAPVLVVAGITKEMNWNPFAGPQINLPLFIFNYDNIEAVNANYVARGFGAGFALVLVVLVLFTIARRIGGVAPGELTRRQRRRLARQGARS
ncbi:MAG TPA: ABC transporter permease subunit [Streptosporangiaceae bacterium]|nr:ABC transporter permease subunit [Streptosporangiaceae bacterium]